MGGADQATVAQAVAQALVQLAEQGAVAGEIHAQRVSAGVQCVQAVVGQDLVIAAQAFDEGAVARGGQADDAVVLAALRTIALEEEGQADGGLARGTAQQQVGGAEEGMLGEEVVEQERGGEQRPQEICRASSEAR